MALFRRRNDEPDNTNPQPAATPASTFDTTEARDGLFDALEKRIGKEYTAIVREDFEQHIERDPIHGVEAAYFCLSVKLIEYVDALTVLSGASLGQTTAPSVSKPTNTDGPDDFTVFRKAS